MNKSQIKHILNEIEEAFVLVHEYIDTKGIDLDSEYKKINHVYFRLFCSHLESLFILVKSNHYSSAILLLRTMLELYVKSYYVEFIVKNRGGSVDDLLCGKAKYPSFFKMVEQLESYIQAHGKEFGGAFSQFTKRNMASYEKFSFFSHGTGPILQAFYTHDNITYTTKQISDVLKTAKGLFITLSMLLFVVQNKKDMFSTLLMRYKVV